MTLFEETQKPMIDLAYEISKQGMYNYLAVARHHKELMRIIKDYELARESKSE